MLHVTRFAPLTPMFQLRRDIDDLFGRVFGQMSGDSQGSSDRLERVDSCGRGFGGRTATT